MCWMCLRRLALPNVAPPTAALIQQSPQISMLSESTSMTHSARFRFEMNFASCQIFSVLSRVVNSISTLKKVRRSEYLYSLHLIFPCRRGIQRVGHSWLHNSATSSLPSVSATENHLWSDKVLYFCPYFMFAPYSFALAFMCSNNVATVDPTLSMKQSRESNLGRKYSTSYTWENV